MQSSQAKNYPSAPNLLENRTIVVTGAGDGIGKVASMTFAQLGANIVLIGRTRSKLEQVNDDIARSTNTQPLIVPLDLIQLDWQSASQLRTALENEYSSIDGLLHNAAIVGPQEPVEHYLYDAWLEVMQINVNAQFLLTRSLLPLLRRSNDASIVFTSSGVGRKGRALWGAYAVSKFATEGFMEVLADEVKEDSSLRANSVNPGGTRTKMRAQAFPDEDPLTLPTPEEHMPLYTYLMGPDSRGVSGEQFDAATWVHAS